MKKVVSIIFIIAMSLVVSIPIFAVGLVFEDFKTSIPDDTSCMSVYGVYDIKMKRYVTTSRTITDVNNKEKIVTLTIPLIDYKSPRYSDFTSLEFSDFLLSFGLKFDDIYFMPLDGSYETIVSSLSDNLIKWRFDTGETAVLAKYGTPGYEKKDCMFYANGFTPQNSLGYFDFIKADWVTRSNYGFFPFPTFAYLNTDNSISVASEVIFYKHSDNTYSSSWHCSGFPANSYTIYEGDFTIGGSVTPPQTVSTHSVAWSGWSNSVNAKGEYINVAWPFVIVTGYMCFCRRCYKTF